MNALVCHRGHTIPPGQTTSDGHVVCPYCPRGDQIIDAYEGVTNRV